MRHGLNALFSVFTMDMVEVHVQNFLETTFTIMLSRKIAFQVTLSKQSLKDLRKRKIDSWRCAKRKMKWQANLQLLKGPVHAQLLF